MGSEMCIRDSYHTERIAQQHYWMTTEDDFKRAATLSSGANVVQYPAEDGRNGTQSGNTAHEKTPALQGFAEHYDASQLVPVEDNGLEPMTFWLPARRSPN